MNLAAFLASKIRNTADSSFSGTVIKVGIASISIGVATMILAFSVLYGFKFSIKEKLFGISSHLQVSKITLNRSYDETPFERNDKTEAIFRQNPSVQTFYEVINKAAILKSDEEINGILLKGISAEYDSTLFIKNLVAGRWLHLADSTDAKEIIISKYLSKKMGIKLNDEALVYFVQNPPRARRLKVVGIYDTGLIDFDKNLIFSDLRLIQKINNWNQKQIGHYEIFLTDFDLLPVATTQINNLLPQDLYLTPITKLLPQFFEWFTLLDRNIVVLIALIMLVAAFNMVSVLLIMIMERIPMIGLLKALGMKNQKIRQIFIINGFRIVFIGLIIGNAIGLGLAYLQETFKFIRLDPENYYVNYVPVKVEWQSVLLVNVLVIVVVGLTLLIPTLFIRNISPVNALKYQD